VSKYLKPRQEYVDRYDRITVESCRRKENFHKNWEPKDEKEKAAKALIGAVNEISLHYDLLYTTLRWWEDKEATISKWMSDDAKRDDLLEYTPAPRGIRCLKCEIVMETTFKDVHDWGDDKRIRVLFMYDCPNSCMPRRAFFDDGEEYRIKPDLCPKCQSVTERKSERIEDKKIITTNTCPKCGNIITDELDLIGKEEVPDPDYQKDRDRFCLTEETAKKNLQEKHQLDEMSKLVDKWKEEEKHKEEYDAIKKIKKLTIMELEILLRPIIEQAGYVKFSLGKPEISKDVFVGFDAQDVKADRQEWDSRHQLETLIKDELEDSNWRLMSDGISYRLGYLSGRFRAYEREEDLLALVAGKKKKQSPES
jgi:hypothetical protein